MRMTIADLMSQRPVRVSPECTADDALVILDRQEVSELFVTDRQGRLLGILPSYEIVKAQLSGESEGATVDKLMSRSVPVFKPEADAAEVARLFRDARYSQFPVVNGGRLVGMITRIDIIRLMSVLRRMNSPLKSLMCSRVKAPKLVTSATRTRRGRPVAKATVRRSTSRRTSGTYRSITR